VARSLVDESGFSGTLKTKTSVTEGDKNLFTLLKKIDLTVKEDEAGTLYLVHSKGAYVKAVLLEDVAKIVAKTSVLSVACNTKHTEDDFIRAFRYAWSDR